MADFGLARNINSENTKISYVGSLNYMAPEVKKKRPVAFKSDMFSLGIILHQMLTKTFPDEVDNIEKGLYKIPIAYSKDILSLLTRLLQYNPNDRPSVKKFL